MTENAVTATAPHFVAYVYPGWHLDPYRPGVDEWALLDNFQPAFDGHLPPLEPSRGRYDDNDPAVFIDQMGTAIAHGIDSFTYFLYAATSGLVLATPMNTAYDKAGDGFTVGATWCLRLPHKNFPVEAGVEQEPEAAKGNDDLTEKRLDRLTIAEIDELLKDEVPNWTRHDLIVPVPTARAAVDPTDDRNPLASRSSSSEQESEQEYDAIPLSLLRSILNQHIQPRDQFAERSTLSLREFTIAFAGSGSDFPLPLSLIAVLAESTADDDRFEALSPREIEAIFIAARHPRPTTETHAPTTQIGKTMAYDDDTFSSLFGDEDPRILALENLFARPENLTIDRAGKLVNAVHTITKGRPASDIGLAELSKDVVANPVLAAVPFDQVVKLVDLVAEVPEGENPVDRLTLAQLRSLTGR